jgi:dolichol kinase
MAIVMGFGLPGILSALLGSIVEKFEYIGKIRLDDNITVPTVSFFTLYALMLLLPTP